MKPSLLHRLARLHRRCRAWRIPRTGEEGGALAFVVIIGVALFFVAALGMHMSLSGRRASVQSAVRRAAFFCADASLERARGVIAAAPDLNALLNSVVLTGQCPNAPAGLTFQAFVRDNVDDLLTNDPNVDVDRRVIVDVSASQDGVPLTQLSALVEVTAGQPLMSDYKTQDRLGARKTGTW